MSKLVTEGDSNKNPKAFAFNRKAYHMFSESCQRLYALCNESAHDEFPIQGMRSCGLITAAVTITTLLLFSNAMGQKKLTTVSPSTWGGTGVQFIVGEKSVAIEYDCAVGEITKLETDQRGHFVATGFHRFLHPGPVRLKLQPKPLPARYEGKFTAGSITYSVFLIETGKLIGKFSADRDKTARIRRCR
jgi:hypothetical protein